MNWAAFLAPLIQTLGPAILNEINLALGQLAQQHGQTLTTTPAHTGATPAAPETPTS